MISGTVTVTQVSQYQSREFVNEWRFKPYTITQNAPPVHLLRHPLYTNMVIYSFAYYSVRSSLLYRMG